MTLQPFFIFTFSCFESRLRRCRGVSRGVTYSLQNAEALNEVCVEVDLICDKLAHRREARFAILLRIIHRGLLPCVVADAHVGFVAAHGHVHLLCHNCGAAAAAVCCCRRRGRTSGTAAGDVVVRCAIPSASHRSQ